jgi:hypothetical protein
MPDSTARLHAAVAAACPILGVSVGTPGDSASVVIAFAPEATSDQRAAAQTVVAGFDWSDAAQAAWDLSQAATSAVSWLATSDQTAAVALRVALRDVYTMLNDGLQARGLDRILEPATAARLIASAQAGGGGPIQLS